MTLGVWVIDLGAYNDAVRIVIVAAFALLAITLPPILRARARLGRGHEAAELGVLVWLIFASGIAAIVVRWHQPLIGIVTLLRLGVVVVGVHYVWSNRHVLDR